MHSLSEDQIVSILSALPDSPVNESRKQELRAQFSTQRKEYNILPMRPRFALSAAALVLILVVGSFYTAGNASITRGSALYPVKRGIERVQGFVAFTSLQQVEYHVERSIVRAEEAVTLSQGRQQVAFAVPAAYAENDAADPALTETLSEVKSEIEAAVDAAETINDIADALAASQFLQEGIMTNTGTLEGISDNAVVIVADLTDLLEQLNAELDALDEMMIKLQVLSSRGVEKVQLNVRTGSADESTGTGSGSEPGEPGSGTGSEIDTCELQAEQRIIQAQRAITQAERKVTLETDKGRVATDAEAVLTEARELLDEARAALDAGDCATAEQKAFAAKKKANTARQGNKFMKFTPAAERADKNKSEVKKSEVKKNDAASSRKDTDKEDNGQKKKK